MSTLQHVLITVAIAALIGLGAVYYINSFTDDVIKSIQAMPEYHNYEPSSIKPTSLKYVN